MIPQVDTLTNVGGVPGSAAISVRSRGRREVTKVIHELVTDESRLKDMGRGSPEETDFQGCTNVPQLRNGTAQS